MDPQVFQTIFKMWGFPEIDLFASRIYYQILTYISWKLDPFSRGRGAFQVIWTHLKGYAFHLFANRSSFEQGTKRKSNVHTWYPLPLKLTVRVPLLLPKFPDLLLGPSKEKHPLIELGNLQLLAWTISGKNYLQKKFQTNLLILSHVTED